MSFKPEEWESGSKLSDWTPLYSPSRPELTTWYNAKTKKMVDYNSNVDKGDIVNTGTTRRSQVETSFGGVIKSADGRATSAATKAAPATGDAVLKSDELKQSGINKPREKYSVAYYPSALKTTKQDRIKFVMRTVEARGITGSDPSRGTLSTISARPKGKSLGEVYLSIPNQINDSNSADWGSATMNPLQTTMAAIGINAMKGQGDKDIVDDLAKSSGKLLQDVYKNLKSFSQNKGNRDATQILLAQEAVQAQGLLSRIGGVVANPNVELLFNGPSLRPFTFSFRMSPRDDFEAGQVKQIIRFFKEGMAVQTTDQDIFLKSPNVFEVQFQSGSDNNPHRSLPRIKTCALIGCDVDYTPDGSYMTFDDPDQGYPMTCYQMTLRFNEIEPVYASDYAEIDTNDIGY